jgi:hypothetical protein
MLITKRENADNGDDDDDYGHENIDDGINCREFGDGG